MKVFPECVSLSQILCQERPQNHPEAVFQALNEKTTQLTWGEKKYKKKIKEEKSGVGKETVGG